ncbi:MAG: hypothetical protein KAG66_15285, partial [Methylococcales bacterium]|nr:hypothetical protein [Methylococcales bacterium]
DGVEVGVPNVAVSLYADANEDGVPDGPAVATINTNGTGNYLFEGIVPGIYVVGITAPAGMISTTGQDGHDSGPYEPAPDVDLDQTDDDDNGTTAGAEILTAPIELIPAGEPTGEPATPGFPEDRPDTYANYTADFGVFEPLSIGNTVWMDSDKDGLYEPADGEVGIAGVGVSLYYDADQDGVADGPAIAVSLTNADGFYLFDTLGIGFYLVQIDGSNFGPSSPLDSLISSTPTEADPNTDIDNDDNGLDAYRPDLLTDGVWSGTIELTDDGEPMGEIPLDALVGDGSPDDDNANMTIDFGFFEPLSIGNVVWNDADNSGIQEAGEGGIAGVAVSLYRDDNMDGV